MKHKLFVLLGGFFITAGLLMAAGCFTMPTSPSVVAHGGGTGGGTIPGGGGGVFPTPTPITGGGGAGSISGTVSNSGGVPVAISAANTTDPLHSSGTGIIGDGPYTIPNLADGTYDVSALIPAPPFFSNTVQVIITNGSAVTGTNLTF